MSYPGALTARLTGPGALKSGVNRFDAPTSRFPRWCPSSELSLASKGGLSWGVEPTSSCFKRLYKYKYDEVAIKVTNRSLPPLQVV